MWRIRISAKRRKQSVLTDEIEAKGSHKADLLAANRTRLATDNAADLWHMVLLSLNLGFAAAYGMLSYLTAPLSRGERLQIKIAAQAGSEVSFLAALLLVASVITGVVMLIRLADPSIQYRILAFSSGFLVLGAAPASWLYAIRAASPYIFWWNEYPTWPRGPWLSIGLEVLLTFVLVVCFGKMRIPLWFSLVPLTVHYSYWAWYMWPGLSHGFAFSAPKLCSLACPASGLAWLRYLRQHR